MTDTPGRWDDERADVDHVAHDAGRHDVRAADRVAALLSTAAADNPDPDRRDADRFLAEFLASQRAPSRASAQRRSIRVAIPAALATLTICGAALAANMPAQTPTTPRLQTVVTSAAATSDHTTPPVTRFPSGTPYDRVAQQTEISVTSSTEASTGTSSHGNGNAAGHTEQSTTPGHGNGWGHTKTRQPKNHKS